MTERCNITINIYHPSEQVKLQLVLSNSYVGWRNLIVSTAQIHMFRIYVLIFNASLKSCCKQQRSKRMINTEIGKWGKTKCKKFHVDISQHMSSTEEYEKKHIINLFTTIY
eukprot:PhF_6_TR26636/c0_g1_i1/m.38573